MWRLSDRLPLLLLAQSCGGSIRLWRLGRDRPLLTGCARGWLLWLLLWVCSRLRLLQLML